MQRFSFSLFSAAFNCTFLTLPFVVARASRCCPRRPVSPATPGQLSFPTEYFSTSETQNPMANVFELHLFHQMVHFVSLKLRYVRSGPGFWNTRQASASRDKTKMQLFQLSLILVEIYSNILSCPFNLAYLLLLTFLQIRFSIKYNPETIS